MSRRFGRNQRRRMRGALSEAASLQSRQAVQLSNAHRENSELRRRLGMAIEVHASVRREMIDPSVFLARVDLSKRDCEPVVLHLRVSELSIRQALYDRSAQESLARLLAGTFVEQLMYAR